MGHPAPRPTTRRLAGDRAPVRPAAAIPALAEVIVLDDHRPVADRSTFLWRRVAVALAVVALLALVTLALGRVAATATPDTAVEGHVVVAPGETLWQVAVVHAPDGSDPRGYLDRIIAVNGFDGAAVAAWEVVLLPAE